MQKQLLKTLGKTRDIKNKKEKDESVFVVYNLL